MYYICKRNNFLSLSNGLELYPKLRFPEFTDPWKSCHLGDIYDERIERGGNEVLLSVTINNGVILRSEIEGKDNSSDDKKNYKTVEIGDMVYNTMRMWQGANGISSYSGIVSPAYTVLKARQKIDNNFFEALFKNNLLINRFRCYSQGLTSDTWNLKYPQIKSIKVSIPEYSEQQKIATMINIFNNRIEMQLQYVNDLKKYKRGLISSIWKQKWPIKKLSMLLEFQNGINASSDKYGSGIKYVSVSDILDDAYITYDSIRGLIDMDVSTIEKYSVTYGDILFQRSSETREDAGKSNVYVDRNNIATFGGFVIRGKKIGEYNPYFMKYALSTHDVRIQITSQAAGAQHINIGQKSLENIKIKYPNMEIQNQIGNMFCTLDKRISLEKKKLTNLNDIRCSLLQRLFI